MASKNNKKNKKSLELAEVEAVNDAGDDDLDLSEDEEGKLQSIKARFRN